MKVYVGVTLFTLAFGSIYEYFGHGIFSFYMQFAFLFPLIFGVVIPLLLAVACEKKAPDYKTGAVYNYGVAVLTVGSVVKGALDIYGTSSALVVPYFVVGPLMIVCGIVIPFIGKSSIKD